MKCIRLYKLIITIINLIELNEILLNSFELITPPSIMVASFAWTTTTHISFKNCYGLVKNYVFLGWTGSLLTEADAGHTDFVDEVYENETRLPGGEWKLAAEPYTDVVKAPPIPWLHIRCLIKPFVHSFIIFKQPLWHYYSYM